MQKKFINLVPQCHCALLMAEGVLATLYSVSRVAGTFDRTLFSQA